MKSPYSGGRFRITSPIGYRDLGNGRSPHYGIDVVGESSKEIISLTDGVVVASQIIEDKSDPTWEWGNYVAVQSQDGYTIYYCHLSKRIVSLWQTVKTGDVIGIEGDTGYSFGSHCHIELRKGYEKCNINGDMTLCNIATLIGVPNSVGIYDSLQSTEKSSGDRDCIPADWAREAVKWAADNKLLLGNDEGDFLLNECCTREHVVVFMYRLFKLLRE